jgi:hypothetical protein
MCLLLAPVLIGFFFSATVNSANEANKAGSKCRKAVYITWMSMVKYQQKSMLPAVCHVGYTSSHSSTEVKQLWAWIGVGWETLQRILSSARTLQGSLSKALS